MTLAERSIAALRTDHDLLAALVADTPEDALTAPSGADDWVVADVLSHLGSGAEIGLAATWKPALEGADVPDQEFNRTVWDRWDNLPAWAQAAGFLDFDERLVTLLENLDPETRESLKVRLGFLPAPISLAGAVGMRLNEAELHGWDVRVAYDPAAELAGEHAEILAEHLAGELGFMLGFAAKTERLGRPVTVAVGDSGYVLTLEDGATLAQAAGTTSATFSGSLAAFLRLVAGRLKPEHTPAGVDVTGDVTLDELRAVFPGY
ncbi:maleylpyruvate isomerase family mycothiol-dependent enzyme [Spongisporangium articulatum]|uniref:Maleylpyruvate isomerase family mycothiol-dependent enzyme n=1 Tax=Spongisporangium articulatum TaxID=3362603 RepID=A0ABW8ASE4_9ACTN